MANAATIQSLVNDLDCLLLEIEVASMGHAPAAQLDALALDLAKARDALQGHVDRIGAGRCPAKK